MFPQLALPKPRQYMLPECGSAIVLRKLSSEEMVEISGLYENRSRAVDELAKASVVSVDGEPADTAENRASFHSWWTNLDPIDRTLIVDRFNLNHYPDKEKTEGFRKSETLVVTV